MLSSPTNRVDPVKAMREQFRRDFGDPTGKVARSFSTLLTALDHLPPSTETGTKKYWSDILYACRMRAEQRATQGAAALTMVYDNNHCRHLMIWLITTIQAARSEDDVPIYLELLLQEKSENPRHEEWQLKRQAMGQVAGNDPMMKAVIDIVFHFASIRGILETTMDNLKKKAFSRK